MNEQRIGLTLQALAQWGVREACVAAGARNAPILAALQASSGLRLWSFFEERCAAFFALGRIQSTGRPVVVVTTSGTAVAETLPAVIEACHQGLPLIILSADRPAHYRGRGAPQSIEQRGLFGPHVSQCLDWCDESPPAFPAQLGRQPLHLNLCLEEPRAQDAIKAIAFDQGEEANPATSQATCDFPWAKLPTAVVAAGLSPAQAAQAAPILLRLGLPVLAEASSNLWSLPDLQDLLLPAGSANWQALGARQLLRLGAVPSARWWRDLESSDLPVCNISQAPYAGLARRERVALYDWSSLPALHTLDLPPAAAAAGPDLDTLLAAHPHSELAWCRRLLGQLPADSQLMLGNSLPIRELNAAIHPLPPRVEVYANRGTNGIDGLISTWFGHSAHATESWIVLGDLSALYDLAAPWVLNQVPSAKRRIAVLNNGGGQIFANLPAMTQANAGLKTLMTQPHALRFEGWAQLFGMAYRRVERAADLNDLPGGCLLLEILPDAAQDAALRQALGGSSLY
jgi:2-succinyl-5-enolpyruvyl-6-hydroxy-3-cyclohexene-1-carboxylate synthase